MTLDFSRRVENERHPFDSDRQWVRMQKHSVHLSISGCVVERHLHLSICLSRFNALQQFPTSETLNYNTVFYLSTVVFLNNASSRCTSLSLSHCIAERTNRIVRYTIHMKYDSSLWFCFVMLMHRFVVYIN
jgi:hypothetical protein